MKKIFKKVLALGLAATMVFSLGACTKDTPSTESDPSIPTESSKEGDTTAPVGSGDKLKVTLCIGRKNDLSFQQSAYEGLMRVEEELSDYYEVNVIEMGEDTTKWKSSFLQAADDGADIIIGTGYQNKENFETIPLEYPETKFILFDQGIDYTADDLSNVLTVLFDANQSGFLAGAAAAYYTESENALNTDKSIGFVGGMDNVIINDFLVGYAEGAKYVDKDMKINRSYVGNFNDTATAKELATAQISQGSDIIFQVAGGAGNGIIEACAEKDGVMVIGVDSDQFETLKGTNLQSAVMTSSLKRLDNALVKILSDYSENQTSVPFGTTATYGLKEDAVGIVFNENLANSIGDENVKELEMILEKIKSGDIEVSKASKLSADELKAIVE